MNADEAEAQRRWPMPYPRARNVNERRSNMVSSALRQGFVEGVAWERERRASSVDAAVQRVSGSVCSECGEAIDEAAVGFEAGGHGMCGSCLHNAVRSGWEPGA